MLRTWAEPSRLSAAGIPGPGFPSRLGSCLPGRRTWQRPSQLRPGQTGAGRLLERPGPLPAAMPRIFTRHNRVSSVCGVTPHGQGWPERLESLHSMASAAALLFLAE